MLNELLFLQRPLDPPSVPIGGYYIGYRANQESVFAYATHSLLNLAPRDVEEFFVTGLKKRANYCVIAQAYNEQGNGPSSKETCATTFEYGIRMNRFCSLALLLDGIRSI